MILRCCDDRLNPPWLPASEWCTSPSRCSPARVQSAISSASSGSAVGIDEVVRQPTMRLLNTSQTNAVKPIPDQVGT